MFMICSMLSNTLHLRILKAVHGDIILFSHRKCPAIWSTLVENLLWTWKSQVCCCNASLWLILGKKRVNWCVYVYGQVLLNIDCALRSLDQFKYLTFLDDDEFIVPIQVRQWNFPACDEKMDAHQFSNSHKNPLEIRWRYKKYLSHNRIWNSDPKTLDLARLLSCWSFTYNSLRSMQFIKFTQNVLKTMQIYG